MATFGVPPGLLGPLVPRLLTWAGLGADPFVQLSSVSNPGAVVLRP